MAKYKFNDYILNDIKEKKTVLELLPKNTINRQKKFNFTVNEIKTEYEVYKSSLAKFILYKYNKLMPKETLVETNREKERIVLLDSILTLGNPITSFFERLGFDVTMYNLVHYYNFSINDINKNIKKLLAQFKEAGIPLTNEDFKMNPYEYVYMSYIFKEIDVNQQTGSVGNHYEKIYWKCSKVFEYLILNFRFLIEKNRKKLERYAILKYRKELVQNSISSYHAAFYEIQKVYTLLEKKGKMTKYQFVMDIIDNKIEPDYYLDDSPDRARDIADLMIRKVTRDNPLEYNKMLDKIRALRYNLIEYSDYLEDTDLLLYFNKKYKKFLQGEDKEEPKKKPMKKLFKKKEVYEPLKIDYSLLWKLSGNKFYASIEELDMNFTSADKDLLFKQNNQIETVYKQMNDSDQDYFDHVVKSRIKENTTIGEMFNIITSFPYFTRRIVKDVFDITASNKEEEAINKLNHIKEMLYNPERKIIDSLPVFADVNAPRVLMNSYRFENLDLKEESFDLGSLMGLIKRIDKILLYYDVCEFDTSIDEIKFLKQVTFLKNNNKI